MQESSLHLAFTKVPSKTKSTHAGVDFFSQISTVLPGAASEVEIDKTNLSSKLQHKMNPI
jgi:hypothetical protein